MSYNKTRLGVCEHHCSQVNKSWCLPKKNVSHCVMSSRINHKSQTHFTSEKACNHQHICGIYALLPQITRLLWKCLTPRLNFSLLGLYCAERCRPGTFGYNCTGNCTCNNKTSICSPYDGQCQCLPGYHGNQCQDECPPDKFGFHCDSDCSCYASGTDFCDHRTGRYSTIQTILYTYCPASQDWQWFHVLFTIV